MIYRSFVVLFALGFAIAFAGCGSEGDSEAGSSFDRARTWIEQQSATIQNVGEMIDAYERNDMQRAAAEMDSLRGTINWEKLGGPEMRDRILTIGTEVYTALDRPEDAARLIENALPHLDGDLRTRWDDLRSRLEDGTLPGTLEPDPAGAPNPAE
jgi:ABC-type glycerol-3-phosphate transport system substrate-binding protein